MREVWDIEKLIEWAYRVQCIDKAQRAGTALVNSGPGDVMGGGASGVIALGCRVDLPPASLRYGYSGVGVNDDAVIIDDAVMMLPAEATVPVIVHGRAGTRPDWEAEGVGRMVPLLDAGGRKQYLWRDQSKRRGQIACLVRNTGASWAQVECARAEYTVWHEALCVLAQSLNGQLERIEVTGPVAPATPWITENQSLTRRLHKCA